MHLSNLLLKLFRYKKLFWHFVQAMQPLDPQTEVLLKNGTGLPSSTTKCGRQRLLPSSSWRFSHTSAWGCKAVSPQTLYYCQVSRFLVWCWGYFLFVFGLVGVFFCFCFFTTTSITNFLRQRNVSILARYIQCLHLY